METQNHILIADIGTESIKTALIRQKKNEIVAQKIVSGYLDEYNDYNGKDFGLNVVCKAVISSAKEVLDKLSVKPLIFCINLPITILKGAISRQTIDRDRPATVIDAREVSLICGKVSAKAQEEISQNYATDAGIMPEDIEFRTFKIVELKIDGYEVPHLQGFTGKTIEAKILATFLPKTAFGYLSKIVKSMGLGKLIITHEAQNLVRYIEQEKSGGIFLDIGGDVTQIFFAKNGKLEGIRELKSGSRAFSAAISYTLGINMVEARILKEKYVKKILSKDVESRIREIIIPFMTQWYEDLKGRIKETRIMMPSDVFVFGGGAEFPEIQDILASGNWGGFPMISAPQMKILYPKDIKKVEIPVNFGSDPRYTPISLICRNYAN